MHRRHAARSYSRPTTPEGAGGIILRLSEARAAARAPAPDRCWRLKDPTPTNALIALHQAKANYTDSISVQRSTPRRT
eukprot:366127-Chlamydomonas_euryale.AAC.1